MAFDIETLDGIRHWKNQIEGMITKLESLEPLKGRDKQLLMTLKFNLRLLEDKEELMENERSRISEEVDKEMDSMADLMDSLLKLDDFTKKK